MAIKNCAEQVSREISNLTAFQRKKYTIDDVKTIIAGRLCHGWAFTGQSREDHDKDVEQINQEVDLFFAKVDNAIQLYRKNT